MNGCTESNVTFVSCIEKKHNKFLKDVISSVELLRRKIVSISNVKK
jgi:hypothetical protein